MPDTGGAVEHLRAKLPVPFRQSVFTSQIHSNKKTGCREGQEKWVFPPMVPPHWNQPFCRRRARKGGLRRGVEGGTSGGKTKRSTSPSGCGRTAPPEVERKRRSEEKKGNRASGSPFFSVLRQFAFIRLNVHIHPSQNYTHKLLFPTQSNLHHRQSTRLNLLGFSRC